MTWSETCSPRLQVTDFESFLMERLVGDNVDGALHRIANALQHRAMIAGQGARDRGIGADHDTASTQVSLQAVDLAQNLQADGVDRLYPATRVAIR